MEMLDYKAFAFSSSDVAMAWRQNIMYRHEEEAVTQMDKVKSAPNFSCPNIQLKIAFVLLQFITLLAYY